MVQLPRFFYDGSLNANTTVALEADTAKHIWQVLRMDAGDRILLTDGKGHLAEGSINSAERHKCNVHIEKVVFQKRPGSLLHLCVGFTKNNSRNEWLLEKATEFGACTIAPLAVHRSEKVHVRSDRWMKILQSAVLQSQQPYLPVLTDVMPLQKVLKQFSSAPQKLIAHCLPNDNKKPLIEMLKPGMDTLMLIGPEGDFDADEVNLCLEHGCAPVSLGEQRLRTETAAMMVAAYFNVISNA